MPSETNITGSTLTRREFVQTSALGVAVASTLPALGAPAVKFGGVPPHRPQYVEGVHGYADRLSVTPGETINFHVSADRPYRMEVYRLGSDPDSPAVDELVHRFDLSAGWLQAIHPGSYVHVANGLRGSLNALTLECWVRPWKQRALGGILTQFNEGREGGFGIFLTEELKLAWRFGGPDREPAPLHAADRSLKEGQWAFVVFTWNGRDALLWLDGQVIGRWTKSGPLTCGTAPIRIGASGINGFAEHFLDADIAMPCIYTRALTEAEVLARLAVRALEAPARKDLAGCWPLTEERGERVNDQSGKGRAGKIINHATWMIGGPSFNSAAPRFEDYEPKADPQRGHGLRLASDDLYECRWAATETWKAPANLRGGMYVARILFEVDAQPRFYHITFVVKRARRAAPASILVLCATNTWLAYNATAFAKNQPGIHHVAGTDGMENSPGDPPAFSFYRRHRGGQGTFQMGLRMPMPAGGPYILYGARTNYSHLARAERFAQVWLEKAGYRFDVVTDIDLHERPELLKDYRVLLINGHSEYWSREMYQGLEKFLRERGQVLCLSGNSLFWRVSFNEDRTIMECRKVDAPGDQLPAARRGECWHSQDGLRGGLLRECGYPGWKLVGLETLGWNNQGDERMFGPYRVSNPGHFLFKQPRDLKLNAGDAFGMASDGGLPRANGHEIDIRLSTLARLQEQPAPAGAVHPVDPEGMTTLANGSIPWALGGAAFDYFFRPIKPKNDQGGEVIYWERPDGGRVFNAGSIGSGWALWADPKFQGLIQNVLSHYGVEPVV